MLRAKPEQVEHLASIALSNTERLLRMINELLDLDRLESGHEELTLQRVDVGALARRAAATLDSLASTRGVRFEIDASRDADLTLHADADRLEQVLTNLYSNAIKFSPEGGTVNVHAAPHDNCVRISVRDQGRGVPAEMRETIFEPFRQVERGDARDKGGTGLGLPISREIVQRHGGKLWVEACDSERSQPGSVFVLELPRR